MHRKCLVDDVLTGQSGREKFKTILAPPDDEKSLIRRRRRYLYTCVHSLTLIAVVGRASAADGDSTRVC